MVREVFKAIIPDSIISIKRKFQNSIKIKEAYRYDRYRYYNFSRISGDNSSVKKIGEITILYHVIEKGLTMPETRLGFGSDRIIKLCGLCVCYVQKYGLDDDQVIHALKVIKEYSLYHAKKDYILDSTVIESIDLARNIASEISASAQKRKTKKDYFKNKSNSFLLFSNSRASVRNFSGVNITVEKLLEVLDLAKNTPSACNRQSWRTYLYSNKEQINSILMVQGGSRGFGHLANKLIVITGELGAFSGVAERNQVFIDGGMYAMNLLYSLHYHEISACILNCSHYPEKDKELRNLCNIRESEVFIAMVVCGVPPESFMITVSKRYNLEKTNTLIN